MSRISESFGPADQWVDPDNRTFEQEMRELCVEVVKLNNRDNMEPNQLAALGEATALIKTAGTVGRVSPEMVLRHPKAQLEDLLRKGMTMRETARNLDVSLATVAALRQTYGIKERGVRKGRPASEAAAGDPQEEGALLAVKTIRSTALAARGEILGTAKMLEQLGDMDVVVEIKITEAL